jgi:hypothetical protein
MSASIAISCQYQAPVKPLGWYAFKGEATLQERDPIAQHLDLTGEKKM